MVKPHILIVNDDAASLLALQALLAGGKHEIVTARSGEEALRHILNHDFAVVLLDVNMPGMDGFDTAEAIHSHPRSSGVPIIFITAYYSDELNRLKAYQKGAVDYLFTPLIPQILRAKVAVFIELKKRTLELQDKTDELEKLNTDLRVQRLQDLERINVALQEEIAERKLAEQRAQELATRDALTGLLNRRSLIDRLGQAVARASECKNTLALLFLDLDRFKAINDTMGHDVGDGLLQDVAKRLVASVRESDMVARLGGDEFVVLMKGASAVDAGAVAKEIVQACAAPFHLGGAPVNTSASIGVSLYPRDGATAHALLKNADLAMYHAKQQRRGSIQFYQPDLSSSQRRRMQFEHELQHALERNEFELYYQPKVEIATGCITGVEALLHWRHPRLGLIGARQFLPAAADSRQIIPIGEWVIASVCEQARRWLDAGMTLAMPIAVNIHTPQLQHELSGVILQALHRHGIPSSCMQLEITESLLAGDADRARAVLRELGDAGLAIAIDGFGAGYSSFTLLNALPITGLKIDQTLTCTMEKDAAVVGAIVDMAHALGLRVVAQGVENEAQLAILAALNCDEYQGYFFSEPLSADLLLPQLQKALELSSTI